MNRQEFNSIFGSQTIGCEKNWHTAENEVIPFPDVTHQHWSNIYWYHIVFQDIKNMPIPSMRRNAALAKKEIDDNFNGEILEWKPEYSYEIEWLNELEMLKSGTEIIDKEGNKIGNILTCPARVVPLMRRYY